MPASPIELKNSLPDLYLNPGRREPSARQASRHCGLISGLTHWATKDRPRRIIVELLNLVWKQTRLLKSMLLFSRGKSSESAQRTCWGPVTHALTCTQLIQYSAVYRFRSLSSLVLSTSIYSHAQRSPTPCNNTGFRLQTLLLCWLMMDRYPFIIDINTFLTTYIYNPK